MRVIQEKCVEYDAERRLSIIVEYIAGKVTQTIDRLIALYRPESVVVGTRGQRSVMQAWAGAFGAPGVGSVSKCVHPLLPFESRVRNPESRRWCGRRPRRRGAYRFSVFPLGTASATRPCP